MFSIQAEKLVEQLIQAEYKNACEKFGEKYHSLHEGYAVLLEEVEKVEEGCNGNKLFLGILWGNIKVKPTYNTYSSYIDKMLHNVNHTIKELAQVGAVLMKIKNTISEVKE